MAYINQEKKKSLMPEIKKVLKKYNMKATFSVESRSTLVCTVKSWSIDFNNHIQDKGIRTWSVKRIEDVATLEKKVAEWYFMSRWYDARQEFDWVAWEFIHELYVAMNDGNHDNTDLMTDYFDKGWYTTINFGTYSKPYNTI